MKYVNNEADHHCGLARAFLSVKVSVGYSDQKRR